MIAFESLFGKPVGSHNRQAQPASPEILQSFQKYFSKDSRGSYNKYRNFDWASLSQDELSLIESLAMYSPKNQYLYMLMGNNRIVANQRDKFIAENFHELNATETQKYNSMRQKYLRISTYGVGTAVGGCSFLGLLYGIVVLPARKSAYRPMAYGFGLGTVIGFALWRIMRHKYERVVEESFKSIIRKRYQRFEGRSEGLPDQ